MYKFEVSVVAGLWPRPGRVQRSVRTVASPFWASHCGRNLVSNRLQLMRYVYDGERRQPPLGRVGQEAAFIRYELCLFSRVSLLLSVQSSLFSTSRDQLMTVQVIFKGTEPPVQCADGELVVIPKESHYNTSPSKSPESMIVPWPTEIFTANVKRGVEKHSKTAKRWLLVVIVLYWWWVCAVPNEDGTWARPLMRFTSGMECTRRLFESSCTWDSFQCTQRLLTWYAASYLCRV